MTVTHRKRQHQPDEIQSTHLIPYFISAVFFSKLLRFLNLYPLHYVILAALNEPGLQIHCDACGCDLTHSIRIKCADPLCEPGDGVDLCPGCFCAGKEFAKHKRNHKYRVVVSHSIAHSLVGSL